MDWSVGQELALNAAIGLVLAIVGALFSAGASRRERDKRRLERENHEAFEALVDALADSATYAVEHPTDESARIEVPAEQLRAAQMSEETEAAVKGLTDRLMAIEQRLPEASTVARLRR